MPGQRRAFRKDDAHAAFGLLDALHLVAADINARGGEELRLRSRERRACAAEQDDVIAQRGQEQRLVHGPLARPVDGERTVTHLPPVAVGTVEHVVPHSSATPSTSGRP